VELARYDAYKPIHQTAQPTESQYLLLTAVEHKILAVPATSVPSERMFSTAGLVVSKLRASTSPELVSKILFLNKNAGL